MFINGCLNNAQFANVLIVYECATRFAFSV